MEEWIMTQAAFDRLWERVQGAAAPPAVPDDTASLRGFLDGTWQCLLLESRLLSCAGASRGALQRLCRGTRDRFAALHTAYYLQTGARYRPPDTCPLAKDALAALRLDWIAVSERAERYASAAQTEPSAELRELYRTLGESELAHAAALRDLIARCLR